MEDTTCCDEYARSSRRGFLRGAVALGGAATVTAMHGSAFSQTSYAADGVSDRTLVVLSMRGAADGLSLVVPHGDPVYYQARPRIAVPTDRLLVKDGMFGLHPSLAPLVPLWKAGKMAAVHATGLPVPNRSHFSAMEEMEDADPGSKERVGWINRLLGSDGTGSPLRGIQFGGSTVPHVQILGSHPFLSAREADSVRIAGPTGALDAAARVKSLTAMWDMGGTLPEGVRTALDVVQEFAPVQRGDRAPANRAKYPGGNLSEALASAARTIRADVGAEVITVDHGSWDHHTGLGTPDNGGLRNMAKEFAGAVAAFFTDLGTLSKRVTLVTISEFGRRVKENNNDGLDHGYGNVMFAFGAGVKGGTYYGRWPGLDNTVDADLLVTTDYRSVLSEVALNLFNVTPGAMFPGFTPTRVGLMQTS